MELGHIRLYILRVGWNESQFLEHFHRLFMFSLGRKSKKCVQIEKEEQSGKLSILIPGIGHLLLTAGGQPFCTFHCFLGGWIRRIGDTLGKLATNQFGGIIETLNEINILI